jgi:hypothetical protein
MASSFQLTLSANRHAGIAECSKLQTTILEKSPVS